MDEKTWYLRTQDETFGPETQGRMVEWAQMGRIQPGQEISDDNVVWKRVEEVPFLDMRFSIDIGDGNPRGPFNKAAADALLASGRLPKGSTLVEVRAPFEFVSESEPVREIVPEPEAESSLPTTQEVVPEVSAAVVAEEVFLPMDLPPAEPVTAAVEVNPDEKPGASPRVVEKVVEKIVEVPVEKIVEKVVEKIVVDETRVKELEGLLEEERRHTSELQDRLDENSRKASEAACSAQERENGLKSEILSATERVQALESELKATRAEGDRQRTALAEATACGERLQASLTAATARGDRLQADLAVATDRGCKLQADLEAATGRGDKLQSDLALANTRAERLQADLSAATARADKLAAELKDAAERENKDAELISHLEEDLKRLPQAASEVADIQAAVFTIMQTESEELGRLLEQERREFDEVKKRYTERSDRLLERRRQLLKHSGANVEEMTRKALIERPEDPRTAQLRKELDELRHLHDRERLDYETKIRELTEQLSRGRADASRASESMRDATQLQIELQEVKERLQLREKELLDERQRNEELRRQQATKQQALMARLAALESPSIGTTTTLSTNQSREAKQVKLPGWMHFR